MFYRPLENLLGCIGFSRKQRSLLVLLLLLLTICAIRRWMLFCPEVYFHMNVVRMLKEGFFPKDRESVALYSFAILICGTLIIFIVQMFKNAFFDFMSVVGIVVGILLLDRFYFIPNGYYLKLFFLLVFRCSLLFLYDFCAFLFCEQRQKISQECF